SIDSDRFDPSPLLSDVFPSTTVFRSSTGQPVAVTVNQHVACYPMPCNSGFVNHLFYDRTKTKTGFISDSTYCQRYHLCTRQRHRDRKSTRLNSSHVKTSYAVFCLKKK